MSLSIIRSMLKCQRLVKKDEVSNVTISRGKPRAAMTYDMYDALGVSLDINTG